MRACSQNDSSLGQKNGRRKIEMGMSRVIWLPAIIGWFGTKNDQHLQFPELLAIATSFCQRGCAATRNASEWWAVT